MKSLQERIRAGLPWQQWLAMLAGVLVFALLNLLLTLLWPTPSAEPPGSPRSLPDRAFSPRTR